MPPAVAALHADRVGEGFLVTLGPRFPHPPLPPHRPLPQCCAARRRRVRPGRRLRGGGHQHRPALQGSSSSATPCLRPCWPPRRCSGAEERVGDVPLRHRRSRSAPGGGAVDSGGGRRRGSGHRWRPADRGPRRAPPARGRGRPRGPASGNEEAIRMYRAGRGPAARGAPRSHPGVVQEVLVWP